MAEAQIHWELARGGSMTGAPPAGLIIFADCAGSYPGAIKTQDFLFTTKTPRHQEKLYLLGMRFLVSLASWW